jgi:diguanylate cyclase (GGDEF)-like protein
MRIEGTFLTSRVGRRIFWTLLLAAALPIGLLGFALHALLSEHFASQAHRQQVQTIKFAGMGLLDRLLVARTTLAMAVQAGRIDADAAAERHGRVLRRAARTDAQGRWIEGDAELAQRWQEASRPAHGTAASGATLLLGAFDATTGARPVWISVSSADRPGERWLGEVDARFLFAELNPDAAVRICVHQAGAGIVFCPDGQGDTARAQGIGERDGGSARWNLFLRSDFGVEDWTLVGIGGIGDTGAAAQTSLARLTALGAVATLLLVGMLGMIQVRRTMVPLERLIAGTRQLGERDYSVRVPVLVDDEFGELARSFNHMAERIGGQERRLLERATRDSLTGMANRAGLYESLEANLGDAQSPFTLMYIDIDRFKEVNDSMGHQAGDELLRAIAERLQRSVPAGTLVARPGGDEFVLLLRGARAAADGLAPRLCAELSLPVALAGRSVVVGASIGMAHHPEHGRTSSDLMRRADMAMYSAKARGGGTAAWFDAALDERMAERSALLTDLRQALDRGEFELHYQPRIDVRRSALAGAEALLRWRHPVRGLVPVPAFIELLEETGLIDRVGLWVIERACGQLACWRAGGMALDTIAVNVSTRQLHDPMFAQRVGQVLARQGLQPHQLELEVTESIFMGDAAGAIGALQRLHDSGMRIALDDFGTGYSSLSYLHKLPIGVLKVDRSFVSELGQRDSALALTRSIVALARALRLRVVAEGVETQRQADLLIELGCDELQGFLYARPLEPRAFERFAADNEALLPTMV